VLIAARHFHHLYDGVVILGRLPRPSHLIVALDWVGEPHRRLLETACALLEWPTVLRADALARRVAPVYRLSEVPVYVRAALAKAVALLVAGKVVVVFPEAYPTIDPVWRTKTDDNEFLPFRPGVLTIARRAADQLGQPVPIVPAGFWYASPSYRRVVLRLGPPLTLQQHDPEETVARLEAAVHALSLPPLGAS